MSDGVDNEVPNVIRTPAEAVLVTAIVVVVSMLTISLGLISATRALPKEIEGASLWFATFLPPLMAIVGLATLSVPLLKWVVWVAGVASIMVGYVLIVLAASMMAVV